MTNKHNLPGPVVRAIEDGNRKYSRGPSSISVTELLKPPQVRYLMQKHRDELPEKDVVDYASILRGRILHEILERYSEPGDRIEKRLFVEFVVDQLTFTVSGQFDRLTDDGILQDWKTASAWSGVYGKPEHHKQLNLYALLCERAGIGPVQSLEIVYVYNDWSPSRLGGKYPTAPIQVVPVELLEYNDRLELMLNLLKEHLIDEPRDCSDEERWQNKRCDHWCDAAPFCAQWAKINE